MQQCLLLVVLLLWQQSCAANEPVRVISPSGSLRGAIVLCGDTAQIGNDRNVSESLIVDDQSRGLRNVFVYLLKDPTPQTDDHSTLDDVTVRIVDRQFVPRAFVARTGRTIRFENAGDDVHHVRITPLQTAVPGFLTNPEQEIQTFRFDRAEQIPLPVRCDIDARMRGWVLVVDHPFAAVTGENGTFGVDNIPAGEHKFRIWHERAGYLEKSLTVKIEANKETHLGKLEYSADRFKASP